MTVTLRGTLNDALALGATFVAIKVLPEQFADGEDLSAIIAGSPRGKAPRSSKEL
jgi:hypothetical protein